MRQNHLKVELAPSITTFTLTWWFILCAGPFTFSLHARKTTLKLTAKTSEEADEWIGSLQDVSILLCILYVWPIMVCIIFYSNDSLCAM